MRGAVRADVDADPSQPRAHETREDGHGNEHRQSARRACERCHLQVSGSTSAPSQQEDDRACSADDTQNTGHPQPPEAARTRDCKDRRRAVGHVDLLSRRPNAAERYWPRTWTHHTPPRERRQRRRNGTTQMPFLPASGLPLTRSKYPRMRSAMFGIPSASESPQFGPADASNAPASIAPK